MSDISPFLKWAGGKRWITARYNWLLPSKYNNYLEPFLGGGAVLFHMKPSRAVLGDVNADLIACYAAIKDNWRSIQQLLEEHQRQHCSEYYYSIRGQKFSDKIEEAARFLYLNRACFNGIYRVNLLGQFNVPKGSKTAILLADDDFQTVSQILKGCQLVNQDFAKTIARANAGDFVFVDPPYTVKHNNNGFIKYNQQLFSWADQLRLRDAVESAARRGAFVLLTNANHRSVRDLYRGVGTMYRLNRPSIISANSDHRRASSELAITIGYCSIERREAHRQTKGALDSYLLS